MPLLRRCIVLLGLLASAVWYSTAAQAQTNRPLTVVTVQDVVWLPGVKRLGINVGSPDQFGAAQYLKNVIANPGFEMGEFASIFLTTPESTAVRVQQDNWRTIWNTERIGQPEGFWDGAEYEVLSGPAAGARGVVERFTHEDGRNTYYLRPNASSPALGPEAAVVVRKRIPGYDADRNPFNRADPGQTRPGSLGRQSLRLLKPDADWQPSFAYYMDSYWRDGDTSAGKLLLVQGNWHFEIWARGQLPGSRLEVTFRRQGLEPFLRAEWPLTAGWQQFTRDFFVPPGLDALTWENQGRQNPVLEFTLRIVGAGDAWVDDLQLYRVDYGNPTVFTDKYINLLRQLHPGIVRNWGGQLGSSLENQLALPWERRPTGHSPRDRVAASFHFSLHEFLEVAQELGAEPWYVIPPTWSAEEIRGLISYLAGPPGSDRWADRRVYLGRRAPWTEQFPVIHLEFGNEMWGSNDGADPFLGATVRGGERLGVIAAERFALMRSHPAFRPERFDLIIGGQYSYPLRQEQIEANSAQHDTIALAPYFGELEQFATDAEMFYPLFARPWQDVRFGKLLESVQYMKGVDPDGDVAVYEINFHTTEGETPLSVRNGFVTGLNGGLALPLYMLTYQKGLGIRNQAAFGAVQFSHRLSNGEFVRLWGMLRDLEATGNKRPTWLGVELANRAVRGDLLVTSQSGDNPAWVQPPINGIDTTVNVPYIQSFAYRSGDGYALVLFNLDLQRTQRVQVQLPQPPDSQAVWSWLTADSIHHNNEASALVGIRSRTLTDFAQEYELTLPPHSMHVLEWGKQGFAPSYTPPTPTPLPAVTPSPTPTAGPPTPTPEPTPTPAAPTPIVVAEAAEPTQPATPLGQGALEPTPLAVTAADSPADQRGLLLVVAVIGIANLIVVTTAGWLLWRRRPGGPPPMAG